MKHEDPEINENFNFLWPNEKMLWVRLIVCLVTGLAIATGLFIGAVMLINELLEK